jgi:MATE family multidrug resistance protein
LLHAEHREYCFEAEDQESNNNLDELNRWPTRKEVSEEMVMLGRITGPMVLMGLLLFSKGMVSALFLGYLEELELAGGSLSICFANITGYSVMSGLAMGMEPICGQAFGAKRWSVLGLTLQRTVLILICATVPIGLLWCNMKPILLLCGQDKNITSLASTYIVFSLPDLVTPKGLSSSIPCCMSSGKRPM